MTVVPTGAGADAEAGTGPDAPATPAPDVAVAVAGLARTFPGRPPVAALAGVDLDLPRGGLTAVVGPSGCGKTTLLRLVAGLDRPTAGSVTVAGRLVAGPGTHVPPERRGVGLVPQEGALFPHLDVAGNVGFGLRGRSRRERAARVGEMLDLVGLPDLARRDPAELSGGQQQRVALARALAPGPAVVLLDEPFSALDAGFRAALRDEVRLLLQASGTTGLLVTHDRAEALSMADHLAVLRSGRVVQAGAPRDLYRQPVDRWTARALGDVLVLAGRREPGRSDVVVTALGPLPLAPGHPHADDAVVEVLCRPEQVRRASADERSVTAQVRGVRVVGPDAHVVLAVGPERVEARWPSTVLPVPGDEVPVVVEGAVVAVRGG